MRTISDHGLRMLEHFEGFRREAYQDVRGIWTVGIGETRLDGRPVRQGDALELDAARLRLRTRCDSHFGPAVLSAIGQKAAEELTAAQFDALVSVCYNIGTEGFRTSTMARELTAGHPENVGAAMMLWHKPAQVIPRRRAERACFETGQYPCL